MTNDICQIKIRALDRNFVLSCRYRQPFIIPPSPTTCLNKYLEIPYETQSLKNWHSPSQSWNIPVFSKAWRFRTVSTRAYHKTSSDTQTTCPYSPRSKPYAICCNMPPFWRRCAAVILPLNSQAAGIPHIGWRPIAYYIYSQLLFITGASVQKAQLDEE